MAVEIKPYNGGPAFPQAIAIGPSGDTYNSSEWSEGGGMSLRDWFAGQAIMTAALDDPDTVRPGQHVDIARVASKAYELADAMLAARGDQS